MMALLSGAWGKVAGWAAAAGAAVLAIGSVLLMARSSGVTAQKEADDSQVIQTTKEAKDVQTDVAVATPDARRDELHQWASGK